MGRAALDAVQRLAQMAEAGRHPQEVAAYADHIAIRWYLAAAGYAAPERLVLLVQELRRYLDESLHDDSTECAIAAPAGSP